MKVKWPDSIIKIFPGLEKVTLNRNSIIKFDFSKKDNRKTYIDNRKVTVLNLGNLSKKEIERVLELSPKTIKKGFEVLEEDYDQKSLDFQKSKPNKQESSLIDYFHGKIPEDDWYALRASVFIKKVFDSGEGGEVEILRKDLRYGHGKRGTDISNLYSANYFETWIKPLYKDMKQKDNFDRREFLEAYNLIIEQYPFAVFVHRGMTVREITKAINKKEVECKKYGIKKLNVHGIGVENINKITESINNLKKKKEIDFEYEHKGGLFVAVINIGN